MKSVTQKLKSRKLWAAVAAFLGALLLSLFGSKDPAAAELLQKGIAALCVYIGGESAVDIAALFKSGASGEK